MSSICLLLAPNQAVDRRHRRAMEEENKKQRKRARKEYIEKIRDLSRFVQKWDKRFVAMKEEQERLQAERDRKKEERREKQVNWLVLTNQQSKRKQRHHSLTSSICECLHLATDQAKAKLELAQQYVEDDWVSEAEAILAEQWELDEMMVSSDLNEHRCIVCNKSFKSEKQYVSRPLLGRAALYLVLLSNYSLTVGYLSTYCTGG